MTIDPTNKPGMVNPVPRGEKVTRDSHPLQRIRAAGKRRLTAEEEAAPEHTPQAEQRYDLTDISPENAQTLLALDFMQHHFHKAKKGVGLAELKAALEHVHDGKKTPDDTFALEGAGAIVKDALKNSHYKHTEIIEFDHLAASFGRSFSLGVG